MRWRVLRGCSVIEANLLCGLLEEHGLVHRVVNGAGIEISREYLAPVDYQVIVQVAENDFAAALDVIGEKEAATIELADPESSSQFGVARESELGVLGRRIRWASLSPFAPLGLLMVPTYLQRVSQAESCPVAHRWTLASIVVGIAMSVWVLMFLLR